MQQEIKYGQLWARHSELVEPIQVGTYRISFEGLKKAINEALKIQSTTASKPFDSDLFNALKQADETKETDLNALKEKVKEGNKEVEPTNEFVQIIDNALTAGETVLAELKKHNESKKREVAFLYYVMANYDWQPGGQEWIDKATGRKSYDNGSIWNEWNKQQNRNNG